MTDELIFIIKLYAYTQKDHESTYYIKKDSQQSDCL